jgi:hypothetical protein
LDGFLTIGCGAILLTLSLPFEGVYSGVFTHEPKLRAIMRTKMILVFITFAFGVLGSRYQVKGEGFLIYSMLFFFPVCSSFNLFFRLVR